MRDSAAWFAERGYTCLEIDLGHSDNTESSEALMKHYESGECASPSRPRTCNQHMPPFRTGVAYPPPRHPLRTRDRRTSWRNPHRPDLHILVPRVRAPAHLPACLERVFIRHVLAQAPHPATRVQLRTAVPVCRHVHGERAADAGAGEQAVEGPKRGQDGRAGRTRGRGSGRAGED